MIRADYPLTACMHESVRPSRHGILFSVTANSMTEEMLPFCIAYSHAYHSRTPTPMIQNRREDAITVARIVVVGTARVDIAEIVAVVVIRAAEPPHKQKLWVSDFIMMQHSLQK